jgi:peptidoglycan-associated lipoprotein
MTTQTEDDNSSDALLFPANSKSASNNSTEEMRDLQNASGRLLLYTIYFDFGSTVLNALAKENLAENAKVLKANPELNIVIEGHSDERGTSARNYDLADKRANAVKDYLIMRGVNPARFTTVSFGATRPLDLRRNEEAWARNRRVEFKIRSTGHSKS